MQRLGYEFPGRPLLGYSVNRGKLFGQVPVMAPMSIGWCTLRIVEIRPEGIVLCPNQDVRWGQAIIGACAPSGKGSKLDKVLRMFSAR